MTCSRCAICADGSCRSARPRRAQVSPRDPRQVRALVNGCIRAFSDIAGWNAAVLENLNRTGQLYVAGHQLTGDQVTDDPSLVEAKIQRQLRPRASPAGPATRSGVRSGTCRRTEHMAGTSQHPSD